MKPKLLIPILTIEAMLCVILTLYNPSFTGFLPAVMAAPFEQIGLFLRWLSLSGTIGNIIAILLYLIISLSPVAWMLVVSRRNKRYAEHFVLPVLSVALFIVLYLMINPSILVSIVRSADGLPVGKAILGSTIYSILVGYALLRILRLFFSNGIKNLKTYVSVLLCLLNMLFVYLIFGAKFHKLLHLISTLKNNNVGNEHLLTTTYVFYVFQFVVDILPYVLDIAIIYVGLMLFEEYCIDRYSMATVTFAKKLAALCGISLAITVISNITYQFLQLIFIKKLMTINSTLQIPVFSIAFVLATLLLSRFIAENKALKDDNDSFI